MTRTARRPRGRVPVALLAAALAGILAPPADAAKLTSVPCTAVAVSPGFAEDRTVFCAAGASAAKKFVGPVNFYTSTDGGRTWSPAVRLSNGPVADGAVRILPSPGFVTDRTLFVETRRGGFYSRTAGETFSALAGTSDQADSGFGGGLPTAYVEALPLAGTARRGALAAPIGGEGCCDAVYDTQGLLLPRFLPPSPNFVTRRYLLPPTFATTRQGVVVRNPSMEALRGQGGVFDDGAAFDDDARVFACDADFACGRLLYEFPRSPGSDASLVSYVGPTFTGGADTYAVVYDAPFAHSGYRLYRSRDSGRSWAPWTSANRLLKGYWWGTQVHVAAAPDAPKRLFLRVTRAAAALEPGVVSQELFRSDDDGKKWRRIGRSWSPGTPLRSELPWNAAAGGDHPIVAAGDGHLFLVGEQRAGRATFHGLFCSRDSGRSWVRGC